jgi:hypothetical protein
MHVAGILLARLSWQLHHQRFGIARTEPVQRFINLFEAGEFVKTRAARAYLADGLCTAQHQHAHDGEFSGVELQNLWRDVLEFRHAARAAVKDIREVLLAQTVERAFNFRFGERHHRIPIVLLITGRSQRVERQRIIFGRRDLFFDQRTEDADFGFGKQRHARIIATARVPILFHDLKIYHLPCDAGFFFFRRLIRDNNLKLVFADRQQAKLYAAPGWDLF